ncbi:cupin domain-containing protein [Alkaliphilus serpentinus]|uniref:Cupin domain-containing protein n=1 Tax=Alkaliphilus serpentinus TaxID=1482731 RepID=A0A833HM40_9FIRM|nr:cupin domain-containing protein [Alkaliphilus serpentinus]KAB3527300.1 cupin domain-containing protein [Alkaliphilus serpentinus]
MSRNQLIKNMPLSQATKMVDLIDYHEGQVVSRTISQRDDLSITLFAFDKGEAISTHSSPGDALVHVLDGKAEITIGEEKIIATEGDVVVMPANIPHGLDAIEKFKMFLVVVKPN